MKLWSGRFEKGTDPAMDAFHSSLPFDIRLAKEDMQGSIAHALMLGEAGIISQQDAQSLVAALKDLLSRWPVAGPHEAEDIHSFIENLLTEKLGDAGRRLHTGRSRNDQVALDMRLYFRRAATGLQGRLLALCELLLELSRKSLDTYLPGYTHLQRAQPITLAHWLMAYFQMFSRDLERLHDARKRINICPLGAGALAGTTYPINRTRTAELLHFAKPADNSLDAVSDRDFCIETVSACAMIMMHLSRFCEELILWSTHEFRFVEMDEGFSTGSSIMPQKKNPDAAELIRGKTGRVYGNLQALLTVMKGLPLAYNKDLQEDKEASFDALDTTAACLEIFTRMLASCRFQKERMEKAALDGFTNATDAADYLVKKGLPFRLAHEVIGGLVQHCIKNALSLADLPLASWQEASPLFAEDIYEAISLKTCVRERSVAGGPSHDAVAASMENGRVALAAHRLACEAQEKAEEFDF